MKPLAEQVAELESELRETKERLRVVYRERDHARKICDAVAEAVGMSRTYDPSILVGKVASAKVEGAREALWGLYNVGHLGKTSVWFEGEMTRDDLKAYIKQHYPAPASGVPVTCAGHGYCVAPTVCKVGSECFAKRTPPSAPEPFVILPMVVDGKQVLVTFTQSDARRIVGMGAQADV